MTHRFSVVEEYAAFGVHRTGTPSQRATCEWLAQLLRDRGAAVETPAVDFDRYVADWSVTIDGQSVASLPLFYEATGRASSANPLRWPAFSPSGRGPMGVTTAVEDENVSAGDIVVAATQSLSGFLAVSNRVPELGSGAHVLQVAGHHGGALASDVAVEASISARIEPGVCHNVIARFGEVDTADNLTIVTTPISGWFACAGERGTGIAVALSVAEQLAAEGPVLFLGATGHELGAFGGVGFHEEFGGRAHNLIHVGANVGCDWPSQDGLDAPDHSYMGFRYAGPDAHVEALTAAVAGTGHRLDTPGRDRSKWFGEAADWLDAGSVLSLVGQNPWFHGPGDLPHVSCSPERTALVADAFVESSLVLLRR